MKPPGRAVRLAAVLLAACLVTLVATTAAAPEPERSPREAWWRTTDGTLTLVTNASADEARGVLDLLAALREVVGGLLFDRPGEAAVPATVILFGDAASYQPFRLYERDGQYLATAWEGLVAVNAASARRPVRRIAAHEYLHALVNGVGLDLPLWLDEGLSEYYSTARTSGEGLVLGEPAADLQKRLRGRPFLEFDELLAWSSDSAGYRDEEAAERFYAQSWLLVHYLLSEPGGDQKLAALLDRLERGETASAALAAVVGLEPPRFERRLREYLNRPDLPRIEVPLVGNRPQWAARALAPDDLAAELAVLATEQLRWGLSPERMALARSWIERAVAGRPSDGDRVAIAARFHEMLGEDEVAAELYTRSAYLDARQGRSLANHARFLVQRPVDDPPGRQRAFAEARLLIGRALEEAPSHPWLRALERRLEVSQGAAGAAGPGAPPRP